MGALGAGMVSPVTRAGSPPERVAGSNRPRPVSSAEGFTKGPASDGVITGTGANNGSWGTSVWRIAAVVASGSHAELRVWLFVMSVGNGITAHGDRPRCREPNSQLLRQCGVAVIIVLAQARAVDKGALRSVLGLRGLTSILSFWCFGRGRSASVTIRPGSHAVACLVTIERGHHGTGKGTDRLVSPICGSLDCREGRGAGAREHRQRHGISPTGLATHDQLHQSRSDLRALGAIGARGAKQAHVFQEISCREKNDNDIVSKLQGLRSFFIAKHPASPRVRIQRP